MSLAINFGGLGAFPTLKQVLGNIPRLPVIGLVITNKPSITRSQELIIMDERLEELREHIENNGGEAPFMIDNGAILRAAPKKKLSHQKHRAKLYAPGNKQIQPLQNLIRCPACGHVKRSHVMCMHCFHEIRTFLKAKKRDLGIIKDTVNPQTDIEPIDEKLLYPKKELEGEKRKLQDRKYVPQREQPLMFQKGEQIHRRKGVWANMFRQN
ncbi:uncharacterized protein RJT21DRAFT_117507 [Scheffersomyces amazonensis]|uniref:uncharacterized protein n=1 Tax=Scheffersomyces amazonensis TaxID=1078765 RepID=UPI00315DEC75